MTGREATIAIVDFLVWCGAGAAILALATLAVRALLLGHVHINGQRATKVEEPLGYWLVIAAFCGCIYFLWPLGRAVFVGCSSVTGTRPNNSFKPMPLRGTA